MVKSELRYKKKQAWASRLVGEAVRDGYMKRSYCCRCGSNRKIHGHHQDYDRPLEVIWLCEICHAELHRREQDYADAMGITKNEARATGVLLETFCGWRPFFSTPDGDFCVIGNGVKLLDRDETEKEKQLGLFARDGIPEAENAKMNGSWASFLG